MTRLMIRQATVSDAAEILSIYRPYIEKTAITFEYTVPALLEFQKRIEQTLHRYPYLVAEFEGELIGYAYGGPYKSRTAYDWAAETSVYVKENCLVKGVGTQLYTALEEILCQQHVVQLLACITAGNQRSEQFHKKLGYQPMGLFPKVGFKQGKWWDVLWMQKSLISSPKEPLSFIPFADLYDDI